MGTTGSRASSGDSVAETVTYVGLDEIFDEFGVGAELLRRCVNGLIATT